MVAFNEQFHYIGALCKRKHDHTGSGQSFRTKGKSDCLECADLRKKAHAQKPEVIAKRKEYFDWYTKTEKFRENQQRYQNSEKGRATKKRYSSAYNARSEVKARKKEWASSPENKAKIDLWQAKHRKTEARRLAALKYSRSEYGKANCLKNYRKRRARLNDAHTSAYSVEQLKDHFAKFGDRCVYCGEDGTNRKVTVDHLLPISRGGADALGNLVPACSRCNRSKSAADVYEWYKRQDFYNKKQWRLILKVLGKTESNYNQIPLL